jgi:hypothetical protein
MAAILATWPGYAAHNGDEPAKLLHNVNGMKVASGRFG